MEFFDLLSDNFQKNSYKVLQAENDIDRLIVSQTINTVCIRETATVVTEGIDNKIMLLYSVNTDMGNIKIKLLA